MKQNKNEKKNLSITQIWMRRLLSLGPRILNSHRYSYYVLILLLILAIFFSLFSLTQNDGHIHTEHNYNEQRWCVIHQMEYDVTTQS